MDTQKVSKIRSFSFAIDPERLTAEEYVQFLGPPPYSAEQCKNLRTKLRAEGFPESKITALVGDGSVTPLGIFQHEAR